jgi:2'-5' RNA ligase
MHEYVHGVVLVLPPPALATTCNELRRRFDQKSASIAPAHISLSSPLPHAPSHEELAELQAILRGVRPLELEVGPIRGFGPHLGVAFSVGPHASFRTLQRVVHSASLFDGVVHARRDVPPHLTIAEFISLEQSNALVAELRTSTPNTTFLCDELTLMVPDTAFRFAPQLSLSLGKA